MPITNKQGTKPKTKAEQADADKAHAANTAEVNKSVDAWRASQGLPPIDRKGKADG